MTAMPFDRLPGSRTSPARPSEQTPRWPPQGHSKEHVAIRLLQHGVLSHALGPHLEYKVRTTIATQPAWQYYCEVFHHGRVMKRGFAPIMIDRSGLFRRLGADPDATESFRVRLANEAAEVHCTRCAVLREFLTLASINAQPARRPSRRRSFARVGVLGGVVLLMLFGFGIYRSRTPATTRVAEVSKTQQRVPQPAPAVTTEVMPSPAADESSSEPRTAEPPAAPEVAPPPETPKSVRLRDLLETLPEKAAGQPRSPTPADSPGTTTSAVHAGDLLQFTGWVQWVARSSDSTYQLYLTPSSKSKVPGLVAVAPPPDQPAGSPEVDTQIETVRTFIAQQLLRQQSSAPRRAVMRQPVFVQLVGHLSPADGAVEAFFRSQRVQVVAAHWEMRPVLDVQFATPPAPSRPSRSR